MVRFRGVLAGCLSLVWLDDLHGGSLCFEAELANRVEPVFEIREDPECSGGRELVIRQGAGGGQAHPGRNGTCRFAIDVPRTGRYRAWLRMHLLDGCSNSIYVVPPNGPRLVVTDGLYNRWHWIRSPAFRLDKGTRELILENREDGVGVDQILLSDSAVPPPWGLLRANCIPGVPGFNAEYDELEISVSGAGPDVPPRPARRHDVSHWIRAPGELPDFVPATGVFPGRPVVLQVWLRNNSAVPKSGSVLFKGSENFAVLPARRQPFEVLPNSLSRVTFEVEAPAALAIGEHPVRFHVRTERVLRRARARLVRPLEWRVVGPFHNPAGAGLDRMHGPEREKDLSATYPGKFGEVRWRELPPREAYTAFAFADLQRLFGGQVDWAAAYARTMIEADRDGEVMLSVMGDDMVRVWIDGKVAVTADASLPATLNRRVSRIVLAKGRHTVLVKSCQTHNYWEFYVSFRVFPGQGLKVRGIPLSEQDRGAVKSGMDGMGRNRIGVQSKEQRAAR